MKRNNNAMRRGIPFIILLAMLTCLPAGFSCSGDGKKTVQPIVNPFPSSNLSFTQHIRPLFLENCAAFGGCHQTAVRAGGLDLQTPSPDFQGDSGLDVVPFNASASLLFQLLFQPVGLIRRMPPEGPSLDQNETEALRTWINEGANTSN